MTKIVSEARISRSEDSIRQLENHFWKSDVRNTLSDVRIIESEARSTDTEAHFRDTEARSTALLDLQNPCKTLLLLNYE